MNSPVESGDKSHALQSATHKKSLFGFTAIPQEIKKAHFAEFSHGKDRSLLNVDFENCALIGIFLSCLLMLSHRVLAETLENKPVLDVRTFENYHMLSHRTLGFP